MAPGVGPLPAAEREIPVADSFARYAATLEPRTLQWDEAALANVNEPGDLR